MLETLQLWWEARRLDRKLTDQELDESTRSVVVALIQTLSNRAFRRPELSSSQPLESAKKQRDFDAETLDAYRGNILPELEPVRAGWLVRGKWSPSLEGMTYEPEGIDDLRLLAMSLARLRREQNGD